MNDAHLQGVLGGERVLIRYALKPIAFSMGHETHGQRSSAAERFAVSRSADDIQLVAVWQLCSDGPEPTNTAAMKHLSGQVLTLSRHCPRAGAPPLGALANAHRRSGTPKAQRRGIQDVQITRTGKPIIGVSGGRRVSASTLVVRS